MDDIVYNSETKEIQFIGNITSYKFYCTFFKALADHYLQNGDNTIPKFSFSLVDEFESSVLPNLIGIGLLISKIHKRSKIPLSFLRTSSAKFLDVTMFFDYVGEPKLISEEFVKLDNQKIFETREIGFKVFDFNPKMLGFYNNDTKSIDYNKNHKIHTYDNSSFEYYSNYLDYKDKKELDIRLDIIRTKKYKEVESQVEKHFFKILKYKERTLEETKLLLSIISEIICNSILYSDSHCIAMLQSKNDKTKISISDIGVGFEGSLKYKPNFRYEVTSKFQGKNKDKLKNYLLIFDALQYSKEKIRNNLFTLLKIVIEKGGKMRIHYENVQVVFSSARCFGCEINPIKCSQCLLNELSSDFYISPVRFFNYAYSGVHIEVDLEL